MVAVSVGSRGNDGGSKVERGRVGVGLGRSGLLVVLVLSGVGVVVAMSGPLLFLRLVLALLLLFDRRTLLIRLVFLLLVRDVSGSANSGGNGSGAVERLRSGDCGRSKESEREKRGEDEERSNAR